MSGTRWMFSGNDWILGFERKAVCFVVKDNLGSLCLRFGWIRFEADLINQDVPAVSRGGISASHP